MWGHLYESEAPAPGSCLCDAYVLDGEPKEVYTIESPKPIISLLTTHRKDRFALVYQDGSMSLHTATNQ